MRCNHSKLKIEQRGAQLRCEKCDKTWGRNFGYYSDSFVGIFVKKGAGGSK